MSCNGCNSSPCCCQQYRGERGKQGLPGRQGNPGARTPGVQSYSWADGQGAPYIMGGGANVFRTEAVIPWEGLTNYPLNTPVRIWMIAYGSALSPDFDIEIVDLTNGSTVIASASNQTAATSGSIIALTVVGTVSNARAAWAVNVKDNNITENKVNLQSLTVEFA